ncbi:MAG: heme ABC exporter ATP-binding protein CcmA [Alphaproteobacteria bacterium]|nr:heme ABC exporter ATP-binding protein CcmA [Alphaproteobacteria bacterium]
MSNPAPTGLAVDDLSCRRGDHEVFAGLSCGAEAGGALVLRGPNGAGKSSLLRVLAGFIPPSAGTVRWKGEDIGDDPGAHRAVLHYVGHLDPLKPVLSAAENLTALARLMGGQILVVEALERFGIAHLRDLPVRFLSAGQRRRLNLARLVATPRPLWLLDEPTVALDARATAELEQLIADHRAAGGVVVAATHIGIEIPGAAVVELAGRRRRAA